MNATYRYKQFSNTTVSVHEIAGIFFRTVRKCVKWQKKATSNPSTPGLKLKNLRSRFLNHLATTNIV